MNTTPKQRVVVLLLLALLMAATRLNHFTPVPDASWAVFFVGGFYLRGWTRWAFPSLMVLAVLVDYVVISGQGLNFWSHYCVSPAYVALVPAYFVLWAGGLWLRRGYEHADMRALGRLTASLLLSVLACHLIAQGSFYWITQNVADPTLAGWWSNYTDWLPLYLRTAALYASIAAVAQVVIEQVARLPRAQGKRGASH